MKLIFCVEKSNGTMLFGKRQTSDKALTEHLLQIIGGSKLWVSKYSSELFKAAKNLIADDNYKDKAGIADYCFIEDKEYNLDSANEIILCRWNRKYPSDTFLNIDRICELFEKVSAENIVGSSHEKITIERYVRSK